MIKLTLTSTPPAYVAAWYIGDVLLTGVESDFGAAYDDYCSNPHQLTPEQLESASFRGVYTWAEIKENLAQVAATKSPTAPATAADVAEAFAPKARRVVPPKSPSRVRLSGAPAGRAIRIDDAPEIPGLAEAAAQPADDIAAIDMTPTWGAIMPALIAVLENGTAEGRAIARAELMSLAQKTDSANAAGAALRPRRSLSAAANPDAPQQPSRAARRAAMLERATARPSASGGFPLWACATDDPAHAIAESLELYSDQLNPFESVRDYVEYPEAREMIVIHWGRA